VYAVIERYVKNQRIRLRTLEVPEPLNGDLAIHHAIEDVRLIWIWQSCIIVVDSSRS